MRTRKPSSLGFRVQGIGCIGLRGLGLRIWGSGLRVEELQQLPRTTLRHNLDVKKAVHRKSLALTPKP